MEIPHESISPEQWVHWRKKRKHTVIGYMFVGVVIGIDYSFMLTTLYPYLKDIIKVKQPNLYFGIIIAVYNLSSTLFGVICGRLIDKTRNVRQYALFALTFQIIGCLMYVIPFSVAFPLIGRALSGFGDPFPSVASGEIIRIYNEIEGTQVLWRLNSVYSIGFLAGPIMPLFFKDVDFYFLSIHFTQLNVAGISMIGLLAFTILLTIFLIQNCSNEIDLKDLLKNKVRKSDDSKNSKSAVEFTMNDANCDCTPQETENLLVSAKSDVHKTMSSMDVVLKSLFSDIDVVLMLTLTLVISYCLFSIDVLQPLVVEEILHWPLEALSLMLVMNGILYFIFNIVMSKYCTSNRNIYIMSIVSIVALIIACLALGAIKTFSRNLIRDIIFTITLIVLSLFGWVIEEVIICCLLAKMVPSNVQSFVETIRSGVSSLSTIIASMTAPLALPALQWWSLGLILMMMILCFCFFLRREHLVLIRQIDFN